MTQVCNLADGTTFYLCDKDLNTSINRLEHDTALPVEWFEKNVYENKSRSVSFTFFWT